MKAKNTGERGKKIRKTVLPVLFILACAIPIVRADTVWLDGHHEIVDGDIYSEIWMYNDCTLDIFGGDIYRLAAYDTTVTDWYDGVMDDLWMRDDSMINIYGGVLDTLAATENSIINLSAYDVVFTHTGGYWDDGQVTGKYYADDTSFIFDLWGQDTYLHINVVPEPATLLLLSLGIIAIRRRN